MNHSTKKIIAAGNLRQIISVHDIEVCQILDNVAKFPMFHTSINWLNSTFPGLVQKCPYTSFKIINASFHVVRNGSRPFQNFANGKYRVSFSFFDDIDKNIGEMTYHVEIFVRTSWEDF